MFKEIEAAIRRFSRSSTKNHLPFKSLKIAGSNKDIGRSFQGVKNVNRVLHRRNAKVCSSSTLGEVYKGQSGSHGTASTLFKIAQPSHSQTHVRLIAQSESLVSYHNQLLFE